MQTKLIIRLAIAAAFSVVAARAPAQQPSLPGFFNSYESAVARAADKCRKLWADPKSDPCDFNVGQNRLAGDILRAFAQSIDPATVSPSMRRAEFNEWALYGTNERGFPQFIKISSIRQIGDRVSVETRYVIDPVASGRKFPEGSYREDLMVTHCTKPIAATAESRVVDRKGKPLYAYKWADPEHLDLAIGDSFTPGSIAALMQKIVCNEGLRTPLLRKQELAAMKFPSLSATISGDGDVFYAFAQDESKVAGSREINLIVRLHSDVEVSLSKRPASDVPSYRTQVSRISLNCTNGTMGLTKAEYYDVNYNLVYLDTNSTAINEMPNNSPLDSLHRIVCNANEAGK